MNKQCLTADIHVGTKGQVVIPAKMRAALGLCEGDTLWAYLDEDGHLSLQKVPNDPFERVQQAFHAVWDGEDATTFIRRLRDEWDD